jgi:hypothetical protein
MDEALHVDLHAVHEVGRQLRAEGATEEEWAAYRAWRDEVLAVAEGLQAA